MNTAVRREPAVLYDKGEGGRVAVLTLNRPEVRNAYDTSMRDALFEALTAVRDDPEIRIMILRGAGPAFSSGGDIQEFGSAPSPTAAREIRWRRDVWGTLRSLSKITIAAVHGMAVGGGFEMAMLCDRCLAARDARFSLPETGLGMIPGVAGTQTLPRLIGSGRATDLVLTGRWLTAAAAKRLGLVARVIAPERLFETARREARRFARLDQVVVASLKRAVHDGLDRTLAEGLAHERLLSLKLQTGEKGIP